MVVVVVVVAVACCMSFAVRRQNIMHIGAIEIEKGTIAAAKQSMPHTRSSDRQRSCVGFGSRRLGWQAGRKLAGLCVAVCGA